MKGLQSLVALMFICIFLTSPILAHAEVRTYKVPDIKNAFCGVAIDFQWCKCAFHNQYCKSVSSDPGSANAYVQYEFRVWNQTRIQNMGEQCVKNGHDWSVSDWSCTIDETETEVRECTEALKNLSTDWEKYSDFDKGIPVNEASVAVQGYDATLDEIADLISEIHTLELQMQIEAEYRLSLRAYKQALVQNIKTNLLKAFWRLSYVTYITIDSAKGAGGSVEKLLNPTDSAEAIGAGLKLIQANTPGHVKELQVSDGSIVGKVKSVGVNASLEALESIVSPSAVVQQVMKDVKSAVVPSADISKEEVAMLRTQHLENKDVDRALTESYAASTKKRGQIWTKEAGIAQKYNELQQWKLKEYERVKDGLEAQCNNQ